MCVCVGRGVVAENWGEKALLQSGLLRCAARGQVGVRSGACLVAIAGRRIAIDVVNNGVDDEDGMDRQQRQLTNLCTS